LNFAVTYVYALSHSQTTICCFLYEISNYIQMYTKI
jgi:hypothetical protein